MSSHEEIKNRLIPLIESVVGGKLNVTTRLLDDGHMDSLMTMDLITLLEEEFGIRIPTEELTHYNFNSLKEMTTLVGKLESV